MAELLTLSQAAKLYNLPRQWLEVDAKRGNLKTRRGYMLVRHGRPPERFVTSDEMKRYVAKRAPIATDESDPLLTLNEIARRVNVQPLTLSRAVRAGELPYKQNTSLYTRGPGRRPKYLIRLSDAKKWKQAKQIANRRRG